MNFNEHIKEICLNEFAGSEKKMTVILDDGYKYLMKMPDPGRGTKVQLSYINNSISEYIGCKIMHQAGIPVQHVILGEYTDEKGKPKVVCACRDVREVGEQMHEVKKINLSSLNAEETSIDNATAFAERMSTMKGATFSKDDIMSFYYDMFVVDSLIGNTDRHNGNWAVLSGPDGIRISPVYDCGSSLSPLREDSELTDVNLQRDALSVTSAILDGKGHRINYYDYIRSCQNPDVNMALKRIVPKLNMEKICQLIDSVPYISDRRREFYKGLLMTRYERVLVPTIKRLYERDQEIVNKANRTLSGDDLRRANATLVRDLIQMPRYHSIALSCGDEKVTICKITDKDALIYNKENTLTGTAQLRRGFQYVKSLLYEIEVAGISASQKPFDLYSGIKAGDYIKQKLDFQSYEVSVGERGVTVLFTPDYSKDNVPQGTTISYDVATNEVWGAINGQGLTDFDAFYKQPKIEALCQQVNDLLKQQQEIQIIGREEISKQEEPDISDNGYSDQR